MAKLADHRRIRRLRRYGRSRLFTFKRKLVKMKKTTGILVAACLLLSQSLRAQEAQVAAPQDAQAAAPVGQAAADAASHSKHKTWRAVGLVAAAVAVATIAILVVGVHEGERVGTGK